MKEATELPSMHSLIDDAHAQANIILDDQYFCFLERPDSMIPLSDVLEEYQSYMQTSPIIECQKKEQLSQYIPNKKPIRNHSPFAIHKTQKANHNHPATISVL